MQDLWQKVPEMAPLRQTFISFQYIITPYLILCRGISGDTWKYGFASWVYDCGINFC